MSEIYDVIVLGAGAMGSAAAYHLTRASQRVLLLEQFEIDHQRGSSYGYSRIIRYAYDHPAYIALARAAYPAWHAVQEAAGTHLLTPTGGLDFGPRDQASLNAVTACLRSERIPHEILTVEEARYRFPQFAFDDDSLILFQADAGVLAASECVRAHVRLAREGGATILDHTPVISLTAHPEHVEIATSTARYQAARLIVTAGSWTHHLLRQTGISLPLTPTRCQEVYFQPEDAAAFLPDRFPVFIAHLQASFGRQPYGIPSVQGSGLKVAYHGGQPFEHPAQIDYTPDDEEIERARVFARRYLHGVSGRLRSTRICLYTMTPDQHFIIDRHPEYAHIVIGAGFSGHGFKFSTLIGRILTDLALHGQTAHDISLFALSRFQ